MSTDSRWLNRALGVLLVLSTAAAASAQTPGAHGARPAPGGTAMARPQVLLRDPRVIERAAKHAARVRESDSVFNGALIGAGVSVGAALVACRAMESWDVCLDDPRALLAFGAVGAGIGAGVDALIRREMTIGARGTPAVSAAPVLGRRARGLRIAVRF